MVLKKEFEELTISVQALLDYKVCERYYDYKYVQKEYVSHLMREINAERFENILKRIVAFFFFKKQDSYTPSYNVLLNRWEKLWYPKDTDAYDLSIEQHEIAHGNLSSYTTAATAALLQFYEDFVDDPGIPILINEKFLVPIGDHIRLEGSTDLILRYKDVYKVIQWSGKQLRPKEGILTFDFAAQKLAFDHRSDGKTKRVAYSLYDLGSTRPGYVEMEPTINDVNQLIYWANDIYNNDIFVSRRGFCSYCRGCDYDLQCSLWQGWSQPIKGELSER